MSTKQQLGSNYTFTVSLHQIKLHIHFKSAPGQITSHSNSAPGQITHSQEVCTRSNYKSPKLRSKAGSQFYTQHNGPPPPPQKRRYADLNIHFIYNQKRYFQTDSLRCIWYKTKTQWIKFSAMMQNNNNKNNFQIP